MTTTTTTRPDQSGVAFGIVFAALVGVLLLAVAAWLGLCAYFAPSMLGHVGYGFAAVAMLGLVEASFQAAWDMARAASKAAHPGPISG